MHEYTADIYLGEGTVSELFLPSLVGILVWLVSRGRRDGPLIDGTQPPAAMS
jgi:hypothetical protein